MDYGYEDEKVSSDIPTFYDEEKDTSWHTLRKITISGDHLQVTFTVLVTTSTTSTVCRIVP
jgi:hypothetical protein